MGKVTEARSVYDGGEVASDLGRYLKSSKRNLQSSEGKRYSRKSINGLCIGLASKKLLCLP